ncbi:MAG: beta strand repeat-containing protein, partial [Prosthecobacter sp.]
LDIGAGNTLTIDDGANGGGIIGVGNFARTIGAATIGQGTLTAGVASDANTDTLYLYNVAATATTALTVNMVIADNGTDALHLFSGGNATVTINADNTFTGGTTIAAGTLNVGGNAAASDNADLGSGAIVNHGTLVFNKSTSASDAQNTFANNITGTGAVTIARDLVTLSGANDYSGATNVSASTTLRAGSATGISSNSRMLLNAATSVLDLNGFDVSVAALRGDQTTASVTLGANTLTLSGSDLANSGGAEILSLGGVQNYQGAFAATAGNLIKNGAYTQVFTAGGTAGYTGTTTVNAGILQTNKALATSGLTVNNTALATSLGGYSTFISNVANSLVATASVNLANAGSTWQINNGFGQSIGSLTGVADSRLNLARGATATNLTVTDNGGAPVTFAGVIQETGAGVNGASFTKAGTNTLILSGGNNYSGTTTITAGTLRIGTANLVQVIPDRSAVSVGATGVFDLNGNSETVGSLAGVAGASILMGAGSLTTGLDNTSTDFAGAITAGAGGLNKVGTGTQTLSGANTFTGAVNITNFGGQSGGGVTIGVGGSLADTVAVRNAGWNTAFTVNATDSVGAVTGTRNSTLALGAGATLTSTYTDGTPTALTASADSASANGRIVRDIDTTLLKVGDLITGTGITAGSYVVQIIDNNTILVNQNVPTGPTTNFAPTVTSTSVLNSSLTGLGGFTKDGTGTLILTGNSTHSGATTINAGTVQIGGIWNGQKFSLHDTLSDSSQLVFAGTGTQTLNFANSSTNLLSFERVGSLAGGSATTTINLTSGANVGILAFGGDNSTSTFSGRFLPGSSAGYIIKEGSGNFTWSNGTTDVFDGPAFIENGTFTIAGAQGFDASNEVYMTNRGTTLNVTTTGGDVIPFLQGGKGDARIILGTGTQPVGGLTSNYLTTVAPIVTLTTNLTVNENTAPSLATLAGVYTFNGVIQGAATLIKSGNHLWRLMGTSTNAHTGETQITAGTLQTGVLSRSAGVGAVSGSDIVGTLSTGTGLRLTGGTLDINGTAQTALRINASSTGGTIQLVNGSLTLSNQNTQSTATVITGTANSVLNLNAASAATLTMTGNSNAFNGTYNVGTNAALTVNLAAGVLGDAARLNLNGTGTQLTVTLADTVGSIAGSGNAVLTQGLTVREGWSGAVSATGYSGSFSGAGALTLSNYGGLTISGNNTHTGGITVSNGASLNLSYGSGNNILPATGALTLTSGNLAVYAAGSGAAILESVASTTLNGGSSSIGAWASHTADTATGQAPGGSGIGLGAITRSAGGTIDFGRNSASTSTANAGGILGGYATFEGTSWAVANGTNAAITGLATFSADTFGAGLHVDITAAGPNAGGSADTLRFSGANAADITGATDLSTGGILVRRSVGANTTTISGALSATGNELIIHQNNPLGDLVLSNVAGTNTIITTSGGGKTIITNSIVGTGATNIGGGYLQVGNGSTTGMVGGGAILNNGTLGINRSDALTFGTAIISGTGNIEQLGAGTTTLGGANTFAGRVTVRNGTLEITNNAGLGAAATAVTNRWANLTSVNSTGSLLVNVAAGGTITEVLNLDGGTLDLRSTVATTLNAPIVLTSDSTIHVSNPGAAVSHIITGEIYAVPGSDLSFTGVGGATPSTLILNPAATTGSRWENTSVGNGAIVQVGTLAGARGFLGTGSISIASGGTLAISTNDNYVIDNTITGAGTLALYRNANYLTGDLSGFSGTLLVSPGATGTNVSAVAELGNDTYGNSFGTGPINLVSNGAVVGTSGIASVRTHFNQDITMSNTFNLTPAHDGTNAKNAQIIRAGLGSVTLDGTINLGSTTAGLGTQRNLIQTEGGGKLFLNATLAGGGASNLLNIVNNNIIVIGGSASQTYNGVLSGNNVWVFNNSGTTTLSGANTVNSGSNYIRQGTVSLTGGAASQDDNDWHVLNGATLNIAATETIGALHMQRGAITNVAAGQTLTVDDAQNQLIAGQLTGAGNLILAGNNFMAMYPAVANTISGNLTINQGAVASTNLTAAIGSFTNITLGSAALNGGLEYTGPGETFAKNLTLAGTGSNYIAANGPVTYARRREG